MKLRRPEAEQKQTVRIEAFSDAVFAIAITLLVLEIHVPDVGETARRGGLAHALQHEWPTYLAYVTSFLTILILWINHQRIFELIRRTDHSLLMLNGLVLMGTTLVPFPTALVAKYLLTPDAQMAAVDLAGVFLAISLFYNILWRHISRHLLRNNPNTALAKTISRQYLIGLVLYGLVFAIAFVSPIVSVVLNLLLAVFFALPDRIVAWATGTLSKEEGS